MTRLSARLVAAPPEAVDDVILRAQHSIVRFLDLDRSTIFQFDERFAATLTHTAVRPPAMPVPLDVAHLEFPWMARQMKAGRVVQFSSLDELPPEAGIDRETFLRVGPRSNVTFPLVAGGRVFGALAFGVLREERRWPRSVVRRLGLLAEIIANTLYRKRADTALHLSEARMNLALASAEVGLWSWDVGADAYWASDLARNLLGLAEGEPPSLESFMRSVHEQDRETLRLALEAAVTDLAELRTLFRIVHPDGRTQWMSCRGRCVGCEGAGSRRILGVLFDVTARVRAEENERRTLAELAHVGRVVTLGELSASLAHELSQPLSAILSNAQAAIRMLGRDAPRVAEASDALVDIADDVKRAGEVIRRVRELVRKGQPETERIDLAAVVHDVLILFRSDARKRRIHLDAPLAPTPPVLADPVQIRQVLMNLVLNAFEALGEADAERRVTIRLAPEGAHARVTVRDNGPGVSPEAREHLFHAFHTTKEKGLGIGLSLCRSIIEAHGGWMDAESGTDAGAGFSFVLPVVQEPSAG